MKPTRYEYPAKLERDPEGGFVVTFPDVPEAITGGRCKAEAIAMAEDALAVALLARVEKGLTLPEAAEDRSAELIPISVPAATAAKLALISVWRESGLSKSALARRLGVDEKAVRRLLDPDHNTRLSQLDRALHVLGGRLVITAAPADLSA